MRITVVFVALVACIAASEVHDEVAWTASSLGTLEPSSSHQPVVVVKKTTYYEPELIAVVIESGIDDIPEETVLIQNYADVLGSSNNEIRLCATDDNKCLDTPVTKFFVPSLFQSIGQNGFYKFFEHAKEVPWFTALDGDVKPVNPILSPKTSEFKLINEKPINLDQYKPAQVFPSDIFKYVSDTPALSGYRVLYPAPKSALPAFPSASGISSFGQTEVSQTLPVSYGITRSSYVSPSTPISPTLSAVSPYNLKAGFAPLDKISTGGSILGGVSTRAYQTPTYYNSPLIRNRRNPYPF